MSTEDYSWLGAVTNVPQEGLGTLASIGWAYRVLPLLNHDQKALGESYERLLMLCRVLASDDCYLALSKEQKRFLRKCLQLKITLITL